MTMTVDEFMARITGIESSGDPNAVNDRTGAHGLFQIMPSNWSPWAQEAGLSPNAPRTPENQRRVARHKMQQYRDQFGSWEAAAVAWFAGPGRAKRYTEGDASVLQLSDGSITVGEYLRRLNDPSRHAGVANLPVGSTPVAGEQGPQQAPRGQQVRDVWGAMLQSMSNQVRQGVGEEAALAWVEPQPNELRDPRVEGDPEQPGDLGIPSEGQPTARGSAPANEFLSVARRFLGTPYVWGGTSPSGFDCSGLIQYAARQVGVDLPRVSRDQARTGREVSLSEAQPGDLIAFPARGLEVGHIGILVGQDENGNWLMLHAPRSGQNVRIDPIGRRQIATVRRIFEGGEANTQMQPATPTTQRTTQPSRRPSQAGQAMPV